MRNIFSNYSQGENRVTSSIISVISKLSLDSITYIFGEIERKNGTEEFDGLIKFEDQASHHIAKNTNKQKTVPDAEISANFKYIFETKITPNSVSSGQISNHLEIQSSKLIVLTPDYECPQVITNLMIVEENKDRLYWLNFDALVEIFNNLVDGIAQDYLSNRNIRLSEHERFLLVELVDYIVKENLLSEDFTDNVLVIAAKLAAWDDYNKYGFYICQENRTFRPANYLAFYHNGSIKKEVPKIIGWIDSISTASDSLDETNFRQILDEQFQVNKNYEEKDVRKIKGQIIDCNLLNINKWLGDHKSDKGGIHKIIFLDQNNNKIRQEVENDSTSKTDTNKKVAFTQGHRYVSFEKLKTAKKTSELVQLHYATNS